VEESGQMSRRGKDFGHDSEVSTTPQDNFVIANLLQYSGARVTRSRLLKRGLANEAMHGT
jgi:hypothetical protein